MGQDLYFIQIKAGNISKENIRRDFNRKASFRVCLEREIVWIIQLWKIGLGL